MKYIMNKLTKTLVVVLSLVAIMVFLASTQANAGLFDSAMTSNWDTVEGKSYKLDVYGFDARAFEWTPLDNPNVRCVFVSSNKSSGVACYDIEK